LFEEAKVIVEFDGRVKYSDGSALWAEKLRQERLAAQGYEVIRVTWSDILDRPAEMLRRIRAAIQRGLRRHSR
jgi:very-short-patch-repair endonuclease